MKKARVPFRLKVCVDSVESAMAAQQGGAARKFHATAWREQQSAMPFRNPRVFMGGAFRPPEYTRNITDAERARQMLRAGKSK